MEASLKAFSASRLDFFINGYLVCIIFLFLFFTGFLVLAEKKCTRVLFPVDQQNDLTEKYKALTEKKQRLDQYRPFPYELVRNLDNWFWVELTYNSNAIEGNTLSRLETKLVIEEEIAIGGKKIKEHLEARNHAHALDWIKRRIGSKSTPITLRDIRNIHSIILKDIDANYAGRYRNIMARISGSRVVLPNPAKILDLMEQFEKWLINETYNLHPVERAAEAHYRLASIHPFVDGNGRTVRLLMNMILLMEAYPYTIIRVEDRLDYLKALEMAQLSGFKKDYLELIIKSVDRSLDIYLETVKATLMNPGSKGSNSKKE